MVKITHESAGNTISTQWIILYIVLGFVAGITVMFFINTSSTDTTSDECVGEYFGTVRMCGDADVCSINTLSWICEVEGEQRYDFKVVGPTFMDRYTCREEFMDRYRKEPDWCRVESKIYPEGFSCICYG